MSAPKSHYEVLGVASNAPAQQIRAAYKQLALQHHPDRNPGDRDAAARFRQVCAAYEVLSDSDKRRAYDAQREGVRLPPAIVDPAAALFVGLVDTAATVADGHLQKAGRRGGFFRRFITETLRSATSGARHVAATGAKEVADSVRARRGER
jgi:molecular chaperone DnaJ